MDPAPPVTGSLSRPVRVEPALRTVRVAAITPCFNRPQDLAHLATDLARCTLHAQIAGERVAIELRLLVIDNASRPALPPAVLPPHIPTRLVRLAVNTGGSGGYNAGMAIALEDTALQPDYLWLVDSDARVEPDTLARLLAAIENDPTIVMIGPALTDTESGAVQEVGGRFDRRTGRFGPAATEAAGDEAATCDYVAACCALVRAGAVRTAGLMPETFLNADDVEWCLRLAQASGGRVAVLPAATAAHPRFDRFGTLPRYFGARNAFGPIDALGLGPAVRFRRALRETLRAINQHLMARPDIAALHIRGLRDAARSLTRGLPTDLPATEPPRPLAELSDALKPLARGPALIDWPRDVVPEDLRQITAALGEADFDAEHAARAPSRSLAAALRRAIAGPRFALAVVPAKGSPAHWLVGRTMVELLPGGFAIRDTPRWTLLARSAATVVRGTFLAARLAIRRPRPRPLPTTSDTLALAPIERHHTATLSIVVLSYNRKPALLHTLDRLRESPVTRDAEIVVVDNGSGDGSAEAVRTDAPWARLVALEANEAIAGFNRGVEHATGDLVLILDDDARPDPRALEAAIELLSRRPELGAATFLPVHPATGKSEWPFAERLTVPRDDWPVMGCCNLVRRTLWRSVGGYEKDFFLYRNDVDLAMKILAAGRGVQFNPAWRCEHDSPGAARKSPRWFHLATRNWIWVARRHARGPTALTGSLLGWVWAHKLAGASPRAQWNALRGAAEGVLRRPPPVPPCVHPDGRAFRALLRTRLRTRRG